MNWNSVIVMFIMFVGAQLFRAYQRRQRLQEIEHGDVGGGFKALPDGLTLSSSWEEEEGDRWYYTATVEGAFPSWLGFEDARLDPIGVAALGPELELIPPDLGVRCRFGMLSVRSPARRWVEASGAWPKVEETAERLARRELVRGPAGLRRTLLAEAQATSNERILRLLADRFLDDADVRMFVESSVSHTDPRVRFVAADAVDDLDTLELLLHKPDAAPLWGDTLRALGRKGAYDVLLRATHCAPPEPSAFLDAIAGLDDSRFEPPVILLLAHTEKEIVERATDRLAKIGTRAALVPLGAAHQRAQAEGLRVALQVAMDVVRARVGPAEPGALSVVSSDKKRGALSVRDSDGALALRDESD